MSWHWWIIPFAISLVAITSMWTVGRFSAISRQQKHVREIVATAYGTTAIGSAWLLYIILRVLGLPV